MPGTRAILMMLAAVACLLLALRGEGPVSAPAKATARDAAVASLGVYIALRSVNAALSFAQEIEVGGSVGLSANAQPLKFLEPIDDTVERVAGALFSVALLAGVLAIGVGPVSSLGFLLLAAGLTIHAARGPLERRAGAVARPVCRAGTASNLTGLLLAVLLPLSLALGGALGEALTRSGWDDAMAQVTEVSTYSQTLLGASEADTPQDLQTDPPGGLLDWLQGSLSAAGQGVSDVVVQSDAYLDAASFYVSQADDMLEASLTLIAIFLLRVLVLPLTLVVVMIALLRQVSRD